VQLPFGGKPEQQADRHDASDPEHLLDDGLPDLGIDLLDHLGRCCGGDLVDLFFRERRVLPAFFAMVISHPGPDGRSSPGYEGRRYRQLSRYREPLGFVRLCWLGPGPLQLFSRLLTLPQLPPKCPRHYPRR